MQYDFSSKVTIPDGVLMRELAGESVILSVISEAYYGLDNVGTQMWNVLTTMPDLQQAYDHLLQVYDVDSERLRLDLCAFIAKLAGMGLLRVDSV